jgi:hypothetical protein
LIYLSTMQWNQNMCRICGQINETCHSIFNKNPPNDIEDKIKKCLKLEVSFLKMTTNPNNCVTHA